MKNLTQTKMKMNTENKCKFEILGNIIIVCALCKKYKKNSI